MIKYGGKENDDSYIMVLVKWMNSGTIYQVIIIIIKILKFKGKTWTKKRFENGK